MIQLIVLNTIYKWIFLLQVLTLPHILVELDVKNVDKMKLLKNVRLRDEASAFVDWPNVILNQAYFELHENDFGFWTLVTETYWKLDLSWKFLFFNTNFSHKTKTVLSFFSTCLDSFHQLENFISRQNMFILNAIVQK